VTDQVQPEIIFWQSEVAISCAQRLVHLFHLVDLFHLFQLFQSFHPFQLFQPFRQQEESTRSKRFSSEDL